MTTFDIILIILFVWIVRELTISILVLRSYREYQHKVRAERTREHFAILRNELMNLAVKDEIDVNSCTFQVLYLIHTFILRRPDQYRELSELLTRTLLITNREEAGESTLYLESKQWTRPVKNIAEETGRGMLQIIFAFSTIFRIIMIIEKNSGVVSGSLRSIGGRLFKKIVFIAERQDPDMNNIRLAQKNLEELSAPA